MTDKRGGKMEKRGGRAAAAEAKRKTFIADAIAKPPSQRTKREREGDRAGNKGVGRRSGAALLKTDYLFHNKLEEGKTST